MNQPASGNNPLFSEVVELILTTVNLKHKDRTQLSSATPLTEPTGLGLDSIEVLEVVVAVEQHFKVKVPSAEEGPKHFATLGSIVEFVKSSAIDQVKSGS